MNILRKLGFGLTALCAVIAFAGICASAFSAYRFHMQGLSGASQACLALMGAMLLAFTLCAVAMRLARSIPEDRGPAPFCHVGEPL